MATKPARGQKAPRPATSSRSYSERDMGGRKAINWRGALCFFMEILVKQIINLSQVTTNQLNQKLGNFIKPKKLPAIRDEFLFLFLHLFNRRIFSRFSEEEGEYIQALLRVILTDILPKFSKNFKEKSFWKKCNKREIEYAPCKELITRQNPLTSRRATISIFIRHASNELVGGPNPEIMVSAAEVAVKSVNELQRYFSDCFTNHSSEEPAGDTKTPFWKRLTGEANHEDDIS